MTSGGERESKGDLSAIREKIRRIARGELGAMEELIALSASDELDPVAAALAEDISLILVKLEGREFLLDRASEAENRLRELNELKNRHLGIAAHDLRNPIGAIYMMASLLARGRIVEAKKQEYLESIMHVSEQMATLVDDLLDVAAIESGRFALELVEGNLARLTEERAALARHVAARKEIDLTVEVAEVADSRFDPGRLNQVVDNLLSNAIKFSPRGASVRLSCRADDGVVEIRVSDEGPGIPAEDLERIFRTYEKTGARPTGGERTTGLGLFIVKQIVDAHGGTIDVQSAPAGGTAVTVSLPTDR